MKDPQRLFGRLERELVYYRDRKRCAVCAAEVVWPEVDIHHVDQHVQGGRTVLENAALVHRHCHPKGAAAVAFAEQWKARMTTHRNDVPSDSPAADDDDVNENGDSI